MIFDPVGLRSHNLKQLQTICGFQIQTFAKYLKHMPALQKLFTVAFILIVITCN